MYPLKFEPIYIKKVWASDKISKLKGKSDLNNAGISWELSAHRNADNVVSNGKYKGIKFSEVIKREGEKLIGTEVSQSQILRVAILGAAEDLSIQVHPNQEYAQIHENDNSKNETWYIMDADEDAYVVAGTKTDDVNVLKRAVLEGTLEKYVIKVPVKKGDIVVIKASLLHALGKGIMAIEIGENGDRTYRFYDYNRGRKLDIKESFDVLNTKQQCFKPKYISIAHDGYTKSYCYFNKEYAIELIDIDTKCESQSDTERYCIYTCVDGEVSIEYENGIESVKSGESIFIPAYLNKYCLKGKCKLIKSYIPNVNKVKNEILSNITR